MKIALYKSNYGSTIIFESEFMDGDDEYIQLSEIVDVDFPLLDEKVVAEKEIAVIDKQIQTVQAAAQSKINELGQRKQELLALPNMSGDDLNG